MSILHLTSSGCIIALILRRFGMPTSECIDAYLEMSEKVSSRPQSHAHRERFRHSNKLSRTLSSEHLVMKRLLLWSLPAARRGYIVDNARQMNPDLSSWWLVTRFVCTYETKALGQDVLGSRSYDWWWALKRWVFGGVGAQGRYGSHANLQTNDLGGLTWELREPLHCAERNPIYPHSERCCPIILLARTS